MGFSTQCIFCGRQAIAKNEQKFPVCVVHKKENLPEMTCACGELLTIKEGRYGAFFLCPLCGPISVKKAMNVNDIEPKNLEQKREITITSSEVDLL